MLAPEHAKVLASKNCTRAVALQIMVISRKLYTGTPPATMPLRPGIRNKTAEAERIFGFICEEQYTV
jgi:hypothetical protein